MTPWRSQKSQANPAGRLWGGTVGGLLSGLAVSMAALGLYPLGLVDF